MTSAECPYPPNKDMNVLDPVYRGLFESYLVKLAKVFPQFKPVVVETRRMKERQKWLYDNTEATRTLYSNHILGRAIDIGFFRLQDTENGPKGMDWRPETYIRVFQRVPPPLFGLDSFGMRHGWDYVHLDIMDTEAHYRNLVGSREDVWIA